MNDLKKQAQQTHLSQKLIFEEGVSLPAMARHAFAHGKKAASNQQSFGRQRVCVPTNESQTEIILQMTAA